MVCMILVPAAGSSDADDRCPLHEQSDQTAQNGADRTARSDVSARCAVRYIDQAPSVPGPGLWGHLA